MKKTYIEPKNTVVALRVRDNVMIIASGGGDQILNEGVGGTESLGGGDVYVDARETISSPDAWDEW